MLLSSFKSRGAGYESVYYGINNTKGTLKLATFSRLMFIGIYWTRYSHSKPPKFTKKNMHGRLGDVSGNLYISYKFSCLLIAVSHSILSRSTPNFRFFITSMCSFWLCGSRVVYPIINRLAPSPSRFETLPQSSVSKWGKVQNHWNEHVNKTHFHKKGFALSLVFKVRVFLTRK